MSGRVTYEKVLVPLDGSPGAERLFHGLLGALDEGSEVVLLHVIPSVAEGRVDIFVDIPPVTCAWCPPPPQQLPLTYLRGLVEGAGGDPERFTSVIVAAPSVLEGISHYLNKDAVDLVLMHTYDRKGLAKLFKPSIAGRLKHRSPVEVEIVRPQDLDDGAVDVLSAAVAGQDN